MCKCVNKCMKVLFVLNKTKCRQNESRPSEGQCQLQSRQSEVFCQNSRHSEGRPSGV